MKLKFITQREVIEQTRKSGFSARATQVFKNKAKYSRKEKHKKGDYSNE